METDRLVELISAKRQTLRTLRELARRQHELIESRQTSGLIAQLAAKQKLLDELTRIESDLNPFRGQDPESRRWRAPEDRARCAAEAAECRELLDEVLALDRQGMETLKARQLETTATIHAAHDAASARSAYIATAGADRARIDLAAE